MSTIKHAAVVAAKIVGWTAVLLMILLAFVMWRDAQQEKTRQAQVEALYKPGPQHWQIVNATKSDGPAMWAINTEDGSVMFCTADTVGTPSCERASQ